MENYLLKYPKLSEIIKRGNFLLFYDILKTKKNLSFDKSIVLFNDLRNRFGLDAVEILIDTESNNGDENEISITPPDIDENFIENELNIRSNAKRINVSSDENEELGFFIIERNSPTKISSDLFISHLEIHPKFRRQGYFKQLLNKIINYGASLNKNRLVLEPDITQGSEYRVFLEALYERYGFVKNANELWIKNIKNVDKLQESKSDTLKKKVGDLDKNGFKILSIYNNWFSKDKNERYYTYKDKVIDNLKHLIETELGISEKDFKRLDVLYKTIKDFTTKNETELNALILKSQELKYRAELCAELIHQKFQIINNKKRFGCLLVRFDIPNWDKITSFIKKEDIYEGDGFGKEDDPHVTVLFGLKELYSGKDLKNWFSDFTHPIEIKLTGVSIFENEEYDVVKFDVESPVLTKLNKIFKKLPIQETYPNYHPHMSISYCKKGTAKKYIKKFKKSYSLTSSIIELSNYDNSEYLYDVKINELINERVKSYMPNTSTVEVKKNCKLGGNSDGTSDQCEKGDINNFKISKLINETIQLDEYISNILNKLDDVGVSLDELAAKIAKKLNLGENPIKIGEGTQGAAYKINDKVLKITSDKSEAIDGKKLVGKNNEYLADIYDVYSLSDPFDNIYVLIKEYLTDVDSNVYEEAVSKFKNFKKNLDIRLSDDSLMRNKSDLNLLITRIKSIPNYNTELKYVYNYAMILKELSDNNIISNDILHQNVGKKPNGNIAYFDIGYSENSYDDSSIDKLEVEGVDLDIVNEELKHLYHVLKSNNIELNDFVTKILYKLNIKSNFNLLGQGGMGSAFEIDNKRVLKITTDRDEAVDSKKLQGKKNEYLGDVYEVYKLNGNFSNIYIIIRELLDVNYDKNSNILKGFHNLYYKLNDMDGDRHYYLDKIIKNKDVLNDLKNDVYKFKDSLVEYLDDYKIILPIIEELQKYNIKSGDIHRGNLGFKPNGTLAYYDIGVSDSNEDDSNIDNLELEGVDLDVVNEDVFQFDDLLFSNNIKIDDFVAKILSKLNINGTFKKLGSGIMGYAFKIDGDRVLKITTDKSEALESKKLEGKKNEYLGDVYNVYKLNGAFSNVYVIIRELLDVNINKNSEIIDGFKKTFIILDEIRNYYYSIARLVLNKTELEKYKNDIIRHKDRLTDFIDYVNIMVPIIEELQKYRISSSDLHLGNMGFKQNGNLAYYDIGLSYNEENDSNIDKLELESKKIVTKT